MQQFVQRWKAVQSGPALAQAYVPLAFAPGEVCQFDWSQEHVELAGVMQTIKAAHFRLTFSRQMFVVAYPGETQEMAIAVHVLPMPAKSNPQAPDFHLDNVNAYHGRLKEWLRRFQASPRRTCRTISAGVGHWRRWASRPHRRP